MPRSASKSVNPSHRLERVAESIRHALAEILSRGEVVDPVLNRQVVTVPAVRMSPDLRLATIAVMPLGGKEGEKTLATLDQHKKELRALVAHRVNLKYAPDLRFTLDDSFDAQSRIDALLRSPEVARDLRTDEGEGFALNDEPGAEVASKEPAPANSSRDKSEKRAQRRSTRVEVNGWVNLDKPVGVTSTQAVAQLKYLFNAKKAGHAGTLDPLASGVLPIAFGEATKTVSVVQDGTKAYRFTIKWGEETDTDDAEGRVVARSDARPSREEIAAMAPRFVGVIQQTPPTFSAIKIAGERAYDLAREGAEFEIAAREIVVHRLDLIASEPDEAVFEAECGKGAYVRAIARDLGRALGCHGHVIALRRTRVGPFWADSGVGLDILRDSAEARAASLNPVEAGLAELRRVPTDRSGAAILRRGQKLLLRGSAAPSEGPAYAVCLGTPIAVGVVEGGYFVSTRVFNLTN